MMLKLIFTLSFLGFLNSNSLAEKGQTASEILTNSLIENNSRFEFFKNFYVDWSVSFKVTQKFIEFTIIIKGNRSALWIDF